jgi:methionyl-tRNA synthetase
MPTAEDAPDGGKAFYVTTPIYYVNDVPHLGHAYTTVAADVLARWHRQRGERAWMLTGTDEHGEKVLRAAQAGGVSPQEWTARLVESEWKPVLEVIDVANDDFIRTTEPRHTERVRDFWQTLYDRGQVYEGRYEGPYCVSCEEFKLPGELLDGPDGTQLCPIHGRPVERLSETNWFFRLADWAQPLLDLYAEHPTFVQPDSARNEVVSFVRQGLQDLSITRSSFDWGVRVPWDESQVLYVWIDALLNYVTAVGYGTDPERFAATWPADVHLVGKDILRFHAVIWPAMLLAAGLEPPRQVFANGWLLVGGEKMSKTKLTGISPRTVVDHFGSDAYRYYFLRAIAFGADGSFSWEHMSAVYTSELANGLGNLASRVAAMVGRYFDGALPAPGARTEADEVVVDTAAHIVPAMDDAVQRLAFADGLAAAYELVAAANAYLAEQQPWQLAKDAAQRERLATVLHTAAEALRVLAVVYAPVMPKASGAIWELLGAEAAGLGALADQRVQKAGAWDQLPVGTQLTKGDALFPRLTDDG